MKRGSFFVLLLTLAVLFCACGAPQESKEEEKVVYVPMWMEEHSVVYYDADLNRTIKKGRDLTEEEIASRDDIDPSMMYGSLLAEPNTKVEYDLHGFIQNVYYLADDGVSYQLSPPQARQ